MWPKTLKNAPGQGNYLEFLARRDKSVGAFLHVTGSIRQNGGAPSDGGDSRLEGVPVAVKDNIAVEGMPLTCGSRILEPLVSPYSATAVERLERAGARVVGKTNLDEFGMGSSTETSALGETNNPWDVSRVAGGSSGGSAAAVAARMVPVALGSDTGGSIRQPAAFCGVYGLKPTYGTVSRHGLVAYASSLEVIGAAAESVDVLEAAYAAMSGSDVMDQSSLDHPVPPPDVGATRIGFLGGELGLSPEVAENYARFVEALGDAGYETEEIALSTLEYVVPAYYTIASAEASANLARFNGVRYGHRTDYSENPEELIRKSRTEGFGSEVKNRIVLGTYVLRSGFQDQYYLRAQKIRTLIRREIERAFAGVDLICSPVFPTQAFPHGSEEMDAFQQKVADRFTGTANLAAIPALTVPSGLAGGLPVGMQFMAPPFGEGRLFAAARTIGEIFPVEFPPGMEPPWAADRE